MTPTSNVRQQFLVKYCCLTGFMSILSNVRIRSFLFSFILLTYNFVIMLCIVHNMWGTLGIVWMVRFLFVIIQKVKKKILVVNKELAKFQQLSSVNFVTFHITLFITTRQNNLHELITETVKV